MLLEGCLAEQGGLQASVTLPSRPRAVLPSLCCTTTRETPGEGGRGTWALLSPTGVGGMRVPACGCPRQPRAGEELLRDLLLPPSLEVEALLAWGQWWKGPLWLFGSFSFLVWLLQLLG